MPLWALFQENDILYVIAQWLFLTTTFHIGKLLLANTESVVYITFQLGK
jgi:hypothetical protein